MNDKEYIKELENLLDKYKETMDTFIDNMIWADTKNKRLRIQHRTGIRRAMARLLWNRFGHDQFRKQRVYFLYEYSVPSYILYDIRYVLRMLPSMRFKTLDRIKTKNKVNARIKGGLE